MNRYGSRVLTAGKAGFRFNTGNLPNSAQTPKSRLTVLTTANPATETGETFVLASSRSAAFVLADLQEIPERTMRPYIRRGPRRTASAGKAGISVTLRNTPKSRGRIRTHGSPPVHEVKPQWVFAAASVNRRRENGFVAIPCTYAQQCELLPDRAGRKQTDGGNYLAYAALTNMHVITLARRR